MAATKIGQIVGYLTLPVIVCWSYGESPSCTSEEKEVKRIDRNGESICRRRNKMKKK